MNRIRFTLVALLGIFLLSIVVIWSVGPGGVRQVSHPTLTRGLTSDPESLDPHKARSVQASEVLRDIGEGLLSYSPGGELVPGVAESWQKSDDGLTYTFTLRDDARWTNGDPVTADQFVFSLRRLETPATGAFYADLLGNIENAREILAGRKPPADLGVAAPDPHTLVIRLSQPTPYLLSLLALPSTFPAHPPTLQKFGDAFTRPGNLVSNGAYKLDAWQPGSMLKLSRNPYYWNDAATSIDEVQYLVLTEENTQLNRFRAGELDVTDTVPPKNIDDLKNEFGDQLHIAPYLGVYFYGFNLTKPPFKDNPELRQALSMAIDRDAIVASVTRRGELPAYSWVPPGVEHYQPRRFTYAGRTQDERNGIARRLYQEAGYGPDNPLHIELRYPMNDTEKLIAVAVQQMWHEVLGVETDLIGEEFKTLLADIRAREVTQVFRSSWIGDYNDAHTFLGIMESNNPANQPGYESAQFDSLMKQAAAQADPDHREYFLEEAEREMLADHPVIPLYFYVSKHLVARRVSGWQDNVLDYHYSQQLSLAPNAAQN
jgi:oligopeptide transport system substrate-binding protein